MSASSNIPAGRELDVQIAENVMGWKTFRVGRELRFTHPSDAMVSPPVPEFSTDIAAAFVVVARMREQGFVFELNICDHDGGPAVACAASFFRWDGKHSGAEATGNAEFSASDSVPLSICLAALSEVVRSVECAGGETFDGDPSRVVVGQALL